MCELGFLYDHRALFRKKKSLRLVDEKKALALYNKALKIHPKSIDALSGIARVYWHRADQRAIVLYRKLMPLYPTYRKWVAFQNVGNAYFERGDYILAEKWYRKAMQSKGKGKGHGLYFNIAKLYYFTNRRDKINYYIGTALKLLEHFWSKRKKSLEYFLTKRQLLQMKNGTLKR